MKRIIRDAETGDPDSSQAYTTAYPPLVQDALKARAMREDSLAFTQRLRQKLRDDGMDQAQIDDVLDSMEVYNPSLSEHAMMDDFGARVATTQKLRSLARQGQRRGFNRQLGERDLTMLSPRAHHVVIPIQTHHYIDGQPADPHMRVLVHAQDVMGSWSKLIMDAEIAAIARLPRLRPKRRKKADPTWEQVLEVYSDLVETTRSNPAMIGTKGWTSTEALGPLPLDYLIGLEPWYVTEDMLTLVEAASEGVVSHGLKLDELVSTSGFAVLERPIWVDHPDWGEVPMRVVSWRLEGDGVRIMSFIDLDATERDLEIDAPGYRSRLWPLMHWMWHPGESADAVLSWSNATEDDATALLGQGKFVMALWLMANQRIALVSGQKPVRSFRRRAEKLSLPSTVLVVKLRRPAPQRYEVGDPRQVEWSHRWIVTGHWRHLWNEESQTEKLVWISPYVKGPESKPLIVKDRLYKLER